MKDEMNYINGKWLKATSKQTRQSPISDTQLITPISTEKEVADAVTAAKNACIAWKSVSLEDRVKIISNFGVMLESDDEIKKDIIQNIINEVGKPYIEAETEVIEAIDVVSYFCEYAYRTLEEEINKVDNGIWPNISSKTIYEPHGVVAFIKPWNYPFSNPLWGIIPALIAGNTIVLKPSDLSSNTSQSFIRLFEKSGIPKGVINLVCGDSETGKYLVRNPDVDMISFTGSVSVGNSIEQYCTQNKIPCSLELGGNDVAIITKDANIDLASSGVSWGAFTNAGQVCTGTKRVIVNKAIEDEFLESVLAITKKLRLKKEIPPLITLDRANEVIKFIQDAKEKGGKVLTGGVLEEGSYLPPTIIVDCTKDMDLYQNEVFGPLLPIFSVSTNEEAISLANTTRYGLGASVWTTSSQDGREIADMLDTGMVWINEVNMPFPQAPWSGRKSSGPGVELSIHGLKKFTKIKHICEEVSNKKREWWYPYE